MKVHHFLRIALAIVAMAGVAYGVWLWGERPNSENASANSSAALIGGPFQLTDHRGNRVSEQDFRGKYMLVFFGFTFCPDVCPLELQNISQALDQLGEKSDQIQPVFITVDPERDTPEIMAEYVANFHPSIVGLTGTPEEIATATRAWRIYYAKVPIEGGSAGDYTMDHSAFIYLMDRQGEYLTHFSHGTSAAEMADTLAKLLS